MGRYWRIYREFFVSSLARELEFRANFIAKLLHNVVWIVFFLLIVVVIYRNTDSVAGWDRGDALVLAATIFLLGSFSSAFFFSLVEIPEQVRRGTLDFIVTKPIDSQFWVSLRRFNFDQLGAIVAGFVLLGYGVATSGAQPDFPNWVAYSVLLVCATALYYAFMLILMTLGIWLVRVDNLWVLGETVQQVARYPIEIYSPLVQRTLTFVLPLAFLATVPASQLVRKIDYAMVLVGLAWSLGLFVAARLIWNFAMRHYTSASS